MKLTEWFPNDVNPAYPGVYEKDFGSGVPEYQYWDGKRWYYGDSTPRKALAHFSKNTSGYPLPRKWRGVV